MLALFSVKMTIQIVSSGLCDSGTLAKTLRHTLILQLDENDKNDNNEITLKLVYSDNKEEVLGGDIEVTDKKTDNGEISITFRLNVLSSKHNKKCFCVAVYANSDIVEYSSPFRVFAKKRKCTKEDIGLEPEPLSCKDVVEMFDDKESVEQIKEFIDLYSYEQYDGSLDEDDVSIVSGWSDYASSASTRTDVSTQTDASTQFGSSVASSLEVTDRSAEMQDMQDMMRKIDDMNEKIKLICKKMRL